MKHIQRITEIFPSYSNASSNASNDRSMQIAGLSTAIHSSSLALSKTLICEDFDAAGSMNLTNANLLTVLNDANTCDDTKEAKNILIKNFIELSENIIKVNEKWKQIKNSCETIWEEVMRKDRELDAWERESVKQEAKLKRLRLKQKRLEKRSQKKKKN